MKNFVQPFKAFKWIVLNWNQYFERSLEANVKHLLNMSVLEYINSEG